MMAVVHVATMELAIVKRSMKLALIRSSKVGVAAGATSTAGAGIAAAAASATSVASAPGAGAGTSAAGAATSVASAAGAGAGTSAAGAATSVASAAGAGAGTSAASAIAPAPAGAGTMAPAPAGACIDANSGASGVGGRLEGACRGDANERIGGNGEECRTVAAAGAKAGMRLSARTLSGEPRDGGDERGLSDDLLLDDDDGILMDLMDDLKDLMGDLKGATSQEGVEAEPRGDPPRSAVHRRRRVSLRRDAWQLSDHAAGSLSEAIMWQYRAVWRRGP